MVNHYETLGIANFSSAEVAKKAYLRLVVQFHPDRNNNSLASIEKTKKLNEAKSIIANPVRKEVYDKMLKDSMEPEVIWKSEIDSEFDFSKYAPEYRDDWTYIDPTFLEKDEEDIEWEQKIEEQKKSQLMTPKEIIYWIVGFLAFTFLLGRLLSK